MDKRERVIRTLELEEPDVVPIHSLGYDRTRKGYADFLKSEFSEKYETRIEGVGNIAEIRWWNADIWQMDPFEFRPHQEFACGNADHLWLKGKARRNRGS